MSVDVEQNYLRWDSVSDGAAMGVESTNWCRNQSKALGSLGSCLQKCLADIQRSYNFNQIE